MVTCGSGTMTGVYRWSPTDDMKHYLNEDGTRYRMFGDRLDVVDERDNPYWILNKNKLKDNTERFTGNFSIKADIADWWWISYRMGIDSYTTDDSKTLAAGGVYKLAWQKGMYSENSYRYKYLSTNLMMNFNKQFGDFNFNLMLGTSTDDTRTWTNYRMAWNFEIPDFYAFDNATNDNRDFSSSRSQKRLIGTFGEFRGIKANFPGRVAFRVSQMVDSKTILDRPGANQLIGRGDMLFSHNGSIDRVQCAYIDTKEVHRICDFIDQQAGYEHAYYLPEPMMDESEGPIGAGSGSLADRDPLFEEAAQIIVQTGVASTSSLQRRYSIGYNRAGKIMDQLEAAGIVGPATGGKARSVLIDAMQLGSVIKLRDDD